MKKNYRAALLTGMLGLASVTQGWAHAFIDHTEPAVGGTVKEPPAEVHLWFNEKVEATFCSVKVFDSSGKEVDKMDAHADAQDARALQVSLPPALPAGAYKVVWRAVATDTHVTKGDFTFRVGS